MGTAHLVMKLLADTSTAEALQTVATEHILAEKTALPEDDGTLQIEHTETLLSKEQVYTFAADPKTGTTPRKAIKKRNRSCRERRSPSKTGSRARGHLSAWTHLQQGGKTVVTEDHCAICLDAQCEVVFDCGHQCCCAGCAKRITDRRCPLCRAVFVKCLFPSAVSPAPSSLGLPGSVSSPIRVSTPRFAVGQRSHGRRARRPQVASPPSDSSSRGSVPPIFPQLSSQRSSVVPPIFSL